VGYVSRESASFQQPGDTTCPQQEQVDTMKLEVQLNTLLIGGAILYFTVAFLLKRKQLSRMARDAMISLVRAGLPGARFLVTAPSPDEAAATAAAAAMLAAQKPKGRPLAAELFSEAAASPDDANVSLAGDEPRLSRPGPFPTGASDVEMGVKAWRRWVAPISANLTAMFGFQAGAGGDDAGASAGDMGSTRELVVERLATNLWNLTQIPTAPAVVKGAACADGPVAEYAITQLHERTFAGYDRWLGHTQYEDLSPKGEPATLGFIHGPDAARRQPQGGMLSDTKLNQMVLYELLYSEAANCRLLPEMLSFTYHAAACAVGAPSAADGTSRALKSSGPE